MTKMRMVMIAKLSLPTLPLPWSRLWSIECKPAWTLSSSSIYLIVAIKMIKLIKIIKKTKMTILIMTKMIMIRECYLSAWTWTKPPLLSAQVLQLSPPPEPVCNISLFSFLAKKLKPDAMLLIITWCYAFNNHLMLCFQ